MGWHYPDGGVEPHWGAAKDCQHCTETAAIGIRQRIVDLLSEHDRDVIIGDPQHWHVRIADVLLNHFDMIPRTASHNGGSPRSGS